MGQGYQYKQIVGPWQGIDARPNDLANVEIVTNDWINAHVRSDNLITQRPGTISSGLKGSTSFKCINAVFPCTRVSTLNKTIPGDPSTFVGSDIYSPSFLAYISQGTDDSQGSLYNGIAIQATISVGFKLEASGGRFTFSAYSGTTLLYALDAGTGQEATPVLSLATANTLLPLVGGSSAIVLVDPNLQIGTDPFTTTSIVSLGPFDTTSTATTAFRTALIWNPDVLSTAATNADDGIHVTTDLFQSKFILNRVGYHDSTVTDSTQFRNKATYFTINSQLWKFDGVRAIMPGPGKLDLSVTSAIISAGGAVDVGVRNYAVTTRYWDIDGTVVEGPLSATVTGTTNMGNQTVTIHGLKTHRHITAGLTGPTGLFGSDFHSNFWTSGSGGGANPVVINVSGSGTFWLRGDPVLANSTPLTTGAAVTPSNLIVQGKIASLTNTALTLSSNSSSFPVPGAGSYTFSRNLTMRLWRQKLIGTDWYLVGEVPYGNDLLATGNDIVDVTADANLGPAYVFPNYVPQTYELQDASLRLATTYFDHVTVHDGLLITATGTTVRYSIAGAGPDAMALDTNSFTVPAKQGDSIQGLFSFNSILYVWTDNSLFAVSGILPQPSNVAPGTFRLDALSSIYGCVNSKSIVQVDDKLVWLSPIGLCSVKPGTYPVELDSPTRAIYSRLNRSGSSGKAFSSLSFDVGRAFYDTIRKLYVCSLSYYENPSSPTTTTVFLVWNVDAGGIWEIWADLDSTGGSFTVPSMGTYLVGGDTSLRRFSDLEPQLQEKYDAADGVNPIRFRLAGSWEAYGDANVPKNFERFKVFGGSDNNSQSFRLGCELQRNFNADSAASKVLDFSTGTGWGLGSYALSAYGNPAKDGLYMKTRFPKARSLRPVFTHRNLYEKVKILGWQYEVSADFKEGKNK